MQFVTTTKKFISRVSCNENGRRWSSPLTASVSSSGADSSYFENVEVRKAEAVNLRKFAPRFSTRNVVGYIESRQNADGGYTFCQGTESNAQDTYYGLATLNLLKTPFPNIEQTIKWLHDFVPDSSYSYYYVTKALKLCGKGLDKRLGDFLRSFLGSKGEIGTTEVYVEVASEFEDSFMITELVNMAGIKIDRKRSIGWLLSYQNNDGGFGAHKHSNLNSTYHAVASLSNLGYPVKSLKGTLGYIRSCEKPSGGFTVVPKSSNPYMENVYYGVSSLDLLGAHARYLEKTAQFVLECQNINGGFARSNLGISTFVDTFYAVSILQKPSQKLKSHFVTNVKVKLLLYL
jgi:hypothetical protein